MSSNEFQITKPEQSISTEGRVDRSMIETASTRQAQEVQAAMVIAKKFPRDENAAFTRIMTACSRKTLAEQSQYAFPRGGTTVSGPSIRLAEVLAQNWGNLDFGICELAQMPGESIVMSYCWDLETNTRQTKVFTVKHERVKGSGDKQTKVLLTDPRDIYEMIANQGARRLRSCILGIIPGDIVEEALNKCDLTLSQGETEPIADRIRKMVASFKEKFSVTQTMIELRLGHKIEAIIEPELVQLRKIFNALKDGHSKREDFFSMENIQENRPKFGEEMLGDPAPEKKTRKKAEKPPEPPPTESQPPAKEPPKTNNLVELRKLMTANGIDEDNVLGWLIGHNRGSFGTLDDVPDEKLAELVTFWPGVLDDLRGGG